MEKCLRNLWPGEGEEPCLASLHLVRRKLEAAADVDMMRFLKAAKVEPAERKHALHEFVFVPVMNWPPGTGSMKLSEPRHSRQNPSLDAAASSNGDTEESESAGSEVTRHSSLLDPLSSAHSGLLRTPHADSIHQNFPDLHLFDGQSPLQLAASSSPHHSLPSIAPELLSEDPAVHRNLDAVGSSGDRSAMVMAASALAQSALHIIHIELDPHSSPITTVDSLLESCEKFLQKMKRMHAQDMERPLSDLGNLRLT